MKEERGAGKPFSSARPRTCAKTGSRKRPHAKGTRDGQFSRDPEGTCKGEEKKLKRH